jgi:predicted MPP superfamily phosphohydrolase
MYNLVISLIFVFLLVVILGYIFAMQIGTKKEIVVDSLVNDKTKIIFFSDLHLNKLNSLFKRNQKLVKLINSENPDIVVFGGDLVSQKLTGGLFKNDLVAYTSFFSQINATSKYFIKGNHDHKYSINEYSSLMRSHGYIDLTNTQIKSINNINLVGLDDLKYGEIVEPTINLANYNICFAHNPDTVLSLLNNYNLIISGHTHAGQGKIFNYYPMLRFVTENPTIFNSQEIISINKQKVIVSAGIGSHFNLRYFQKPKFSIIELVSKN